MKISRIIYILLAAGLTYTGIYSVNRIQKHYQRINAPKPKAEQISWRAVEGWTVDDIKKDLDQKGLISSADFEAGLEIAASQFDFFGETKRKSLEGYLFPDTYFLPKQPLAKNVIDKMLLNTETKISEQMLAQIKAQKRTLFEVLTLASIVEREVGRNSKGISVDPKVLQDEREVIAGIFMNRLAIGMPLQSDATITYLTKKKSPSATYEDLKIDSPYNTYKYAGLPPGPIANPSLGAIKAAITPRNTDYLYFLSKPDGTAVYAKTLEEHNQNKARYLK